MNRRAFFGFLPAAAVAVATGHVAAEPSGRIGPVLSDGEHVTLLSRGPAPCRRVTVETSADWSQLLKQRVPSDGTFEYGGILWERI